MPSRPDSPRRRLVDAATTYVVTCGGEAPSLRRIAEGIGTSHRMLIYHFGSKQGLLAAIVDHIQQGQFQTLEDLMNRADLTPVQQAQHFWAVLTQDVAKVGPLVFELAAASMRGEQYATEVPELVVGMWLEPLTQLWQRAGFPATDASTYARLGLAVANGLLLDVLLTGDTAAAREAMAAFTEKFTSGQPT